MPKANPYIHNESSLFAQITSLKGVTSRIVKPLHALGIHTIENLLFHIPYRYDDFSNRKHINKLIPGDIATIRGTIEQTNNNYTWKKHIYLSEAAVSDSTGSIRAVWFNQPYLARAMRPGRQINISGKIILDKKGLVMQNPAYEFATGDDETLHTGRIVPVYSGTLGITSRWLRFLIKNALPYAASVKDPLPKNILERQKLLPLSEALRIAHFPDTTEEAGKAKRRLAFDELFFIQLAALSSRNKIKKERARRIPLDLGSVKQFVSALPFRLTNAQRKAAWEIVKDMENPSPMNRLLEGDVGSGKTVVAALAALNTAKNGWQTAAMAPTEVLALQHFSVFGKLFSLFSLDVGLLTSVHALVHDGELNISRKMKKQEFLKLISDGKLPLVIGTHALLSERVAFKNLAFVIVDEQHRFGVKQRATLAQPNAERPVPHLLSMTATPIPRTLALTVYGDLDISLLDEMPKNRKKIITRIVSPAERHAAYAFIRKQVQEGRQAFVICPRIEVSGSDAGRTGTLALEVKTVKEEYKKLSGNIFQDLNIAMLHGKMKAKEKEEVMRKFKNKEADILVSTSVVEVGVDVPNASVMMIEGAEQFGLAQLHQFRGRVGRAEHQSYCLLFETGEDADTNRRLKALVESNNGFELAEKDLKFRGPGNFWGTRQWGLPDLAMASLSDVALVKASREEAARVLEEDPSLIKHPSLLHALQTFGKKIHFE